MSVDLTTPVSSATDNPANPANPIALTLHFNTHSYRGDCLLTQDANKSYGTYTFSNDIRPGISKIGCEFIAIATYDSPKIEDVDTVYAKIYDNRYNSIRIGIQELYFNFYDACVGLYNTQIPVSHKELETKYSISEFKLQDRQIIETKKYIRNTKVLTYQKKRYTFKFLQPYNNQDLQDKLEEYQQWEWETDEKFQKKLKLYDYLLGLTTNKYCDEIEDLENNI